MLLGMLTWVIVITMVVGWAVDILMSRGFAYFFAPAFAEIKRSVIYATGRLFLSFVYSGLLTLAVVFSLKLVYAGALIAVAGTILVVVALAAQLVWILYLYRTSFGASVVFYVAVIIAHTLLFFLIAQPVIGLKANSAITDFVDQAITPRLKVEADVIKEQLATAASDRDSVKAKVTDLHDKIAQDHATRRSFSRTSKRRSIPICMFSARSSNCAPRASWPRRMTSSSRSSRNIPTAP